MNVRVTFILEENPPVVPVQVNPVTSAILNAVVAAVVWLRIILVVPKLTDLEKPVPLEANIPVVNV